jgi:hypothetical protein
MIHILSRVSFIVRFKYTLIEDMDQMKYVCIKAMSITVLEYISIY